MSTKSVDSKHPVAVHWFRNGLRLHDNPSLLDACQNSSSILPLYIIDPDAPFAQTAGIRAGAIRANFVLESIREMDQKLKENNSRLVVLLGKPEVILPKVMEQIDATALYYEREPAAPIREMDALVLDQIDRKKVKIQGYDTHTLHPMEHYLAHCKGGVAPSTYGVFTKIFNQLKVPEEVPTINLDLLPPLPSSVHTIEQDGECPSMSDLGYDMKDVENRFKNGIEVVGGEDAAIALLDTMMKRTQWVCTFEKPKTSPNALKIDTTGLSACKFFVHYLSSLIPSFLLQLF